MAGIGTITLRACSRHLLSARMALVRSDPPPNPRPGWTTLSVPVVIEPTRPLSEDLCIVCAEEQKRASQ